MSFSSRSNSFTSKLSSLLKVPVPKHGQHKEESLTNETLSSKTASPRLFALLIGINKYDCSDSALESRATASHQNPDSSTDIGIFTDLRGAVRDAEQFHEYLVTDLLVPSSQITILRDKEATRDKIIQAFRDLATNIRIKEHDSILIFYAGHGGSAKPPKTDPLYLDHVELFIPVDYNKDPSNSENMGIPDYTLAALLNNLAKKKGENITVIFDCCHSASASRQTTVEEEVLVRSGPSLTYLVPDDLDIDIWGIKRRGITNLPTLKDMGNRSYIVLTACSSSQEARENLNGGYFTTALLKYLKQNPQSALNISCFRIISDLKIEGQNPQCEGRHIWTRAIFQNYIPPNSSQRRFSFSAAMDPTNTSKYPIILKGGLTHGLAVGCELVVLANTHMQAGEQRIGIVVLTKVSLDKSIFEFKADFPGMSLSDYPDAIAVFDKSAITMYQSHLFAIYVDRVQSELAKRVKALGCSVLVKDIKSAHIHLSSTTDKQLCFQVVDAGLLGVQLKPHFTPDTEADLTHALTGLSHYYRHLKQNSTSLSTDNIFVSLFRVQDNGHSFPRMVKAHDADNLISKDTKVANIVVTNDDEALYGIEITNGGEQEKLYPVLLYFDNVDFTITRVFWHMVTLGGETDSPWPLKGKSMTIGYGVGAGSGVPPFSFYLANENDVEAGFFKLFIFDTAVGLQNVEQDTPLFAKSRGYKPLVPRDIGPSTSRCGAITFLVIQRRG